MFTNEMEKLYLHNYRSTKIIRNVMELPIFLSPMESYIHIKKMTSDSSKNQR